MKKEFRSISNMSATEDMTIEGYALKFDTFSEDLGGYIETIHKNALDETNLNDVVCLMNHDENLVLGRTKNETLQLTVDEIGLHFKCKLADTQNARDLYTLVKRGDVDQCSFGFFLDNKDYEMREENGVIVRHINKFLSLYDVSVVTYPAYQDTSVESRSIKEARQEAQNFKNESRKKKLNISIKLAHLK